MHPNNLQICYSRRGNTNEVCVQWKYYAKSRK